MATFELPRYFLLSLETSYHSTTGYAMHMISGVFYFICLAIIGITFANILELGSLSMMIYSKRGLSFSIFLHSLVDISAAIICLKSRTLASFFGLVFAVREKEREKEREQIKKGLTNKYGELNTNKESDKPNPEPKKDTKDVKDVKDAKSTPAPPAATEPAKK